MATAATDDGISITVSNYPSNIHIWEERTIGYEGDCSCSQCRIWCVEAIFSNPGVMSAFTQPNDHISRLSSFGLYLDSYCARSREHSGQSSEPQPGTAIVATLSPYLTVRIMSFPN